MIQKTIDRRRLVRLAAASAFASGAVARNVRAQAYPSRPIRLIAPFPAGGGTDSAARIIAARLSELLGQQVVIDNRPGAGSNIGAEAAARSAPDGYTLLLGAPTLAINRFIYPSLNYDSVTDLAPVSLLCRYPNILAVPMSSPLTSVRSFIDYAKANPGRVTYSSPGIGTTPHLSGELFKRMAGIELVHVPYRGAGAGAITDTIAGRIDSAFNTTGSLLQTVRSGQLRGLAVTTAQRFPTAPELPTIAESGIPGFDVSSWYSLWVPAKTPPDIIAKLNAATVTALAEGAVRARFETLGVVVESSTPQGLGALLQSEIEKWGPIIKAAGISAGN
jgi:tripartite-type tricarboxylate transporter receptor subunit TctC